MRMRRMTIGNHLGTTRIGSPQLFRNQQHEWSNRQDCQYLLMQLQTNVDSNNVAQTWGICPFCSLHPSGLYVICECPPWTSTPVFRSLTFTAATGIAAAAAALINLHFATRSVGRPSRRKSYFRPYRVARFLVSLLCQNC